MRRNNVSMLDFEVGRLNAFVVDSYVSSTKHPKKMALPEDNLFKTRLCLGSSKQKSRDLEVIYCAG